MGGGGGVGSGEGGRRVFFFFWGGGGVRVDVNGEVKFLRKFQKKKIVGGGGVGRGRGRGGGGSDQGLAGGDGGSKVWGRWVMLGMGM